MAEQSFLTKLGLRFGAVGSSVVLGLAAPIADANYSTAAGTAANRSGAFFDQTVAAEKISYVVGGQTGPYYTRSGAVVAANYNGKFGIPSGVTPVINGAVLTQRYVVFETTGIFRWNLYANNNAEPGANAGSGPIFQAYSDLGVAGDTVLTFARAVANGMSMQRPVVVSNVAGCILVMSSNVATNRLISINTTALGARWQEQVNSVAESGGDAGSNYALGAYSDTGLNINFPVTIGRVALGNMTMSRPTVVSAGTLAGTQIALSSSATWNNAASTFTGFNVNTTTTTSAAGSLLLDLQVGGVSRFSITGSATVSFAGWTTMAAVDTDLLSTAVYACGRTTTLTASVADGFALVSSSVINGLFTVARLNWIELDTPTGSATVTDAPVLNFDAAAGTHCCIDAATAKTTPGTVNAWMVHNVNGTLYYAPIYTSKTS